MNSQSKDGQIKVLRIEILFQLNAKLCQNKVNNYSGED